MKKKLYAFDFDGTITKRDTLIAFIRYAKGTSAFVLGFLLHAPLLVLMKLGLYPNWKAKQRVFAYFFKGLDLEAFNDLCQRFGAPDNEFGMFVPLQPLMKLLVGSDDEAYRGNVLRMEQKDANTLILHTESNNPGPLYYALHQCFPDLEIEES